MKIRTFFIIGFLACISNTYAQGQDVFSQYNLLFQSVKSPDKAIAEEKNSLAGIDNDTNKISHQLNLLQAYLLNQHADSAWMILKGCHKLLESNAKKYCSDRDYWWVAQTYNSQKQKDKVQWWLDSAITRLHNSAELNLRQAYASALSSFYKQNNNFPLAIKFQALADSLLLTVLQEDFKARQDSVAAVITGIKDSLAASDKRLIARQKEFDTKSEYWLIALALLIFFQICFVIYLFLKGRREKKGAEKKEPLPNNSIAIKEQNSSYVKLRNDITNIYGLTGLLLDKPRSGDDLTYLKSLQNQAFEIFIQLRPDAGNISSTELDGDKIIRKLKGIRVLIVSADNTAVLMLKEYLKKKIRLCTINVSSSPEGIDTTQADVIIADDVESKMTHVTSIPVIHITSDGRGIRKPFVIDEVLQALMDVYEPSVKNDIEVKEDLKPEDIAGKEDLSKLEKLNKQFSEARLTKNKENIIPVVREIQKNIEDDSNKKWFETILYHHEELSDLQLELALRNIQTFLQRKM